MNTLKELLESNRKSAFYYWKIFWNRFYAWFEEPKPVNEKDWVGLKIHHSVIPKGWTSENAFKFLQKEYEGKIMIAYKD